MSASELPRAPRFRIEGFEAVADSGRAFHAAMVLDLSASGCLLRTDLALAVGDTVTVIPTHPDPRLPVEIVGRVVRAEEADAGEHTLALEFDGMSSEQVERLHSFLVAHGQRSS